MLSHYSHLASLTHSNVETSGVKTIGKVKMGLTVKLITELQRRYPHLKVMTKFTPL